MYYVWDVDLNRLLFTSRQGRGFVALSGGQAHNILCEAFHQAGLNGKIAAIRLGNRLHKGSMM